MKNLQYIYIALISISILLVACKEVDELIVLDPSQTALFDTTYISTTPIAEVPQKVLMEEFSGVRCNNCPKGADQIHEIENIHTSKVIVATIHTKFLSTPYGNDQDLFNQDAKALGDHFGDPAKPSTLINRKKFNTQNIVISGATSVLGLWNTYVDQEIANTSPVDIKLEEVFKDVQKRSFRYRMTLKFASDQQNVNLGFFLTESDIEAEQLLPDGSHKEDYIHEHILRKYIGSVLGETITAETSANTVIIKEFEIDLNDTDFDPNAEWKMDNMELVAFIRASDESILNVAKLEL